MSLQEIEFAIEKLDSREVFQLSDWLIEYRNHLWDKQIEQDIEAGRLDKLLDEVRSEIRQGLTKPL